MQPSRTDSAAPCQDVYIWVGRWQDFQTYTTKRGETWAPPWIKIYPRLLDDDAFMDLTEPCRLLLINLWMLFAKTGGKILWETSNTVEGSPKGGRRVAQRSSELSRKLNQRVTKGMVESLSHAGFIDFCSGTVREQRWNMFRNGSALEVEVEKEHKPKAVSERTNGHHPQPPLELAPIQTEDPDADIDFNGPAIPQRTARGMN